MSAGSLPRRVGGLALLVVACLVPSDAALQQDETPIDTDLVEETGISLMIVDVEVRDRNGNPVTGLTKEDFRIVLNGRSHAIYSVDDLCPCRSDQRPSLASGAGDRATTSSAPVEAASQENVTVPARLEPESVSYILFLDFSQLDLDSRDHAVDEAKRWVRETLQPGDRVSVAAYASRPGLKILTGFTNEKAALLYALESAATDIEFADTFPSTYDSRLRECHACCKDPMCTCDACWRRMARDEYLHGARSLKALKHFLEGLDNVPGRKALLLFHERGAVFPARWYPTNMFEASQIGDHVTLLDDLAAEANLSRTAIYTVTTDNHTGNLGENLGANLAEFTGGDYNRPRTAMRRVTDSAARACACFYRLAMEPTPESLRKVNRVKVEVRDRRLAYTYRVRHLNQIDRWMRTARALLAHPERAQDVPLVAAVVPVACNEQGWDVKVEVALPASALEQFREGDAHRGRWEIGAMLSRKQKAWEMLALSEMRKRRAGANPTTIVHERLFRNMRPGSYELRTFVRDRWADAYGGAMTDIVLPRQRSDALVGPLLMRGDGRLLRTSLPLTKKDEPPPVSSSASKTEQGAIPLGDDVIRAGEPLELLTWACPSQTKVVPDIKSYVALEGEPLFRIESLRTDGAGACVRLTGRLDTSLMEPGEYTYHVQWNLDDGKSVNRAASVFTIAADLPEPLP